MFGKSNKQKKHLENLTKFISPERLEEIKYALGIEGEPQTKHDAHRLIMALILELGLNK